MSVMKLMMMVALAGWIYQQQEDVIDYLREEVRALKEVQGRSQLRAGSGAGWVAHPPKTNIVVW